MRNIVCNCFNGKFKAFIGYSLNRHIRKLCRVFKLAAWFLFNLSRCFFFGYDMVVKLVDVVFRQHIR